MGSIEGRVGDMPFFFIHLIYFELLLFWLRVYLDWP